MSLYFSHKELTEHEARAAQDLFARIVEAERNTLSDTDRADPRAYLLRTWHEAAEAVMRPVKPRLQLEEELAQYRPKKGPFELEDDA